MAASHSATTFVAQPTFEQDIQSQSTSQSSGNVVAPNQAAVLTQAALQHSLALSSSNPIPQQIQQVTIQQSPIQPTQQLQQQPQIIQAVPAAAADDFQSSGIKNEGFSTAEVHYVDPSEHAAAAIYTNGTIAQPTFTYNDNNMYSPQVVTTFIDNTSHQQVYTTSAPSIVQTVGSVHAQTYMQIPSQVTTTSHGNIQEVKHQHPVTHTTRASPATVSLPFQSKQLVQWLLDNYETAEGVSLPRSTLYSHYLQHCQANKIDAVNAASFGKLIRSVFLGLRTRRLGTRGNSKYHYYGIRIQPSSPLNALTDDSQIAMRQSPANQKRLKPVTKRESCEDAEEPEEEETAAEQITPANSQAAQHQQYLGDTTQGLPEFDKIELDDKPLPEGVTVEDIEAFRDLYREHCEAILDVVVNLQFAIVEALWQTFWRTSSVGSGENADGSSSTMVKKDESVESRLPVAKLVKLCSYEPVLKYVKDCDHTLYQSLVEILIPDVLRPIPGSLTQAIRNFAKSLETWLAGSLNGVTQVMIDTKLAAVSAFSQTLRRYTSLNHLAQAARAVLQNPQQINQMLADLNRVDFANVQEQASWVCGCDDQMVHQLENDFKVTLQQQNSLEQWAEWLENVVNTVLKTHENKQSYAKAARQFLLKWSFYSSMIIRDLTLRSAASFGSFHLIRLLYDEYMFYLVEHKVASATGATPIAVMGEYVGLGAAMALGLDILGNNLTLSAQNGGESGTSRDSTHTATQQQDIRAELHEPESKRPRNS